MLLLNAPHVRISRIALAATAVLLFAAPVASAQETANPFADCKKEFGYSAQRPYARDPATGEGTLSGAVSVVCDGTQVFADEVRWDEKTIRAEGNLLVIQEGLRVTADRMEMDRKTRLGTFYNAWGTTRLSEDQPDRDLFGTLEPEVMFRADKIERIGPRTYRLTNGWFTTCMQPEPRWAMTGSSGTVTLDDSIAMKNVLFKVKGVPVIYAPYLYYPLNKEDRKTGFLIPTYSNSNIRGPGISAAFFWAINRSQDATLYWDGYWQYNAQGGAVEYRYAASEADRGTLRVHSFWEQAMVLDSGAFRPQRQEWEVNGGLNQRLGSRFHLVGNVDYFSDTVSQQLYQQSSREFTQSSRRIDLTVQGWVGKASFPIHLEGQFRQEDIFIDLTTARRLGRTPRLRAYIDQKAIGGRGSAPPVYFGGYVEAVNLDARPDLTDPTKDQQHWRVDGIVNVQSPVFKANFMSITPSASLRLTNWTETRDPVTGLPVPVALTRSLFDVRADIRGPSFYRQWNTPSNGFATGFRHVIEPRVSTQWMTAFDSIGQVLQIDPSIDGIVGGTTTIRYSLANRIVAAVRRDDGTTTTRDIVTVSIGQTYYSNALAAISDTGYLRPIAANFLPVEINTTVAPTDGVFGEFRVYIHPIARAIQEYFAGTRIDTKYIVLRAGWAKREVIPSVPELSNPALASHYLNGIATAKLMRGRTSVSYSFDYDIQRGFLLQQRVIAGYMAQCCGFTVDYQVRGFGHLAGTGAPPVDRRWSFSVTLAGIGTFSNPFGSFRQ